MKVKKQAVVIYEFQEELSNLLENWDATLEINGGDVVAYIPSILNEVTGDVLREAAVVNFGPSFKP